MQLVVNGEARQMTASTVAALVGELGLDARRVAVERNLAIVPKSQFGQTPLHEGDRIEIVHFIGGG